MDRNPYICLAIVVALATVAVVSVAGIIIIDYSGHPPSQALTALASSAVGAIAGALAMSPHARGVTGHGKADSAHGQHQVPSGT